MIARARLAWAMFRGRSVMYGVKMEFDGHVRLKGDHPMTVANCVFTGRIGPPGPGDFDLDASPLRFGAVPDPIAKTEADDKWRGELYSEWLSNHAEHCGRPEPHAVCLWPPPASLAGWTPTVLRNAR